MHTYTHGLMHTHYYWYYYYYFYYYYYYYYHYYWRDAHKRVDMGLTSTQARANTSLGHLV